MIRITFGFAASDAAGLSRTTAEHSPTASLAKERLLCSSETNAAPDETNIKTAFINPTSSRAARLTTKPDNPASPVSEGRQPTATTPEFYL